ncbi:outer membrane beta-barrel protein [Leptolyngbya sp. 15MV]|nr:outer membrane beta-barrel protein [Leptolyngbya sp. 15MV]
MTFRKALLAATILAMPAVAQAQLTPGFYIGGGVGLNLPQEADVSLSVPGAAAGTRSGKFDFDWEPAVVLSLGYAYGNGLRAEIEVNHRLNDVEGSSGFGVTGPSFERGRVRTYGVMVNAFYDLDLGPGSWVVPYVGAGVGYLNHAYSRVARGSSTVTNLTRVGGDEWQFGYQGIIGAAFPINGVMPGLSLTAEYRFMGTLQPELDATTRNAAGVITARGNAEVDNFNHSVFIGLRYAFGVAP